MIVASRFAVVAGAERVTSSSSGNRIPQSWSDLGLFEAIENFLRGDKNYNFKIKNMDLNVKVRKKYPILMKIIEAAADAEGNVEEHFRQDFIKKNWSDRIVQPTLVDPN